MYRMTNAESLTSLIAFVGFIVVVVGAAGSLIVWILRIEQDWRRSLIISRLRDSEDTDLDSFNSGPEQRRRRLAELVLESRQEKLVETRSGFRSLGRISVAEAAAQLAIFRWQIEDPLLLRLARVVDALAIDSKEAQWSDPAPRSSITNVSLRVHAVPIVFWLARVLRGYAQERRLPYVAIQTRDPYDVRRVLEGLADWLDISVAIEPSAEFYEIARCESSGRRGEVGGSLISGADQFGLTCAHTLDGSCGSRSFGATLSAHTMEPDVALVTNGGHCFGGFPTRNLVEACDISAAKLLASREVKMVPAGKSGRVLNISLLATYSGRTHEFPHVQLGRDVPTFMDIRLPWKFAFSRPGDSGSWVVNDQEQWLGVLVAADRYRRTSYAALAAPILDYLRTAQIIGSSPRCFTNP